MWLRLSLFVFCPMTHIQRQGQLLTLLSCHKAASVVFPHWSSSSPPLSWKHILFKVKNCNLYNLPNHISKFRPVHARQNKAGKALNKQTKSHKWIQWGPKPVARIQKEECLNQRIVWRPDIQPLVPVPRGFVDSPAPWKCPSKEEGQRRYFEKWATFWVGL